MSAEFVSAVVAAGGLGLRLGADRPKQFLDLAGRPMLARALDALASHPRIGEVVVALPEATLAAPPDYLRLPRRCPVRLVAGGRRRQDSVARAVAAVDPAATLVLVHDAARPFVSGALIDAVIDAAARDGAAIAGLPVSDTVKLAREAPQGPVIDATIPRERVYLAQTPQVFRRAMLTAALAAAGDGPATDEAALVERAGHAVTLVPGDPANVKVTTADDLARARATLGAREAAVRIGTGYDLHRLVAGRPLILGGVRVPFDLGLDGHSDADVVCHAVTDAVLGAAAAGDIGRLFPDTEAAWKDADSLALLRGAMDAVRGAGYRVGNVDVTVIAQRPKLLPHVEAMRRNLAEALGVVIEAVSVKGKTNEGQDSMGRQESMACHAVALLLPADGGAA
jgi:2-C-methyl-D-erythritol 4-phosphate cytidylyltransferase / 2-C-methyl-D-erythritol 2,4-cyclodiphosphate synthase